MRAVTVKDRQNIFDIAVQTMGDVNAAYDLARLNAINVTTKLTSGQVLKLPDTVIDKDVVKEYTTRKWYPATSDQEQDNILSGIGYWYIEVDNQVQ